jgi:CBS domain-containing protein
VSLEEGIAPIVTKDVRITDAETTVKDAATLMVKEKIGCLVIFSLKGAIGIVTERDMLRKVTAPGNDPNKMLVREIMSRPLITTSIHTTVGEAAKLMIKEDVKRLIVTDGDGGFAGLLTMTDMVRWMASKEQLSDSLMDYLKYEVV